MNRKAFVFSTTGFLLIIPAIILAASFMSMLETGSTGVFIHVRGEKTFSLFETAETDLDRAMDISGRRAVIAAADYVLTYDECLNSSTYSTGYGTGATGAVKELMITGNLTTVNHGIFYSSLTPGATLEDWINAFPEKADSLGFNVSLTMSSGDLYITPVNDTWFYATLKVNANIENVGGNVTYNGPLPRTGNTTKLIFGGGINATIFNCAGPVANPPPDSTISSPTDLSTIPCSTTEITGSADDDSGVSRVDVNLSNTWYEANLSAPGASSTDWNYSWLPAVDGDYTICSHATDDNTTGQSTDDCITTTVSGCPVTCNIILDSSYTPSAQPTTGSPSLRYRRADFRVLNNDPSNNVTIDNMTVAWSKSGVVMEDIEFGGGSVWSGCAANNTVQDITDQTISSGGLSTIEIEFENTGCSGNPDMRGTDFMVAFGTDQGVCSVSFSV